MGLAWWMRKQAAQPTLLSRRHRRRFQNWSRRSRLTLARVPGRMVPTSMTSWFKTAGPGGIGSMRREIRCWKGWRRRRERRRKACGPIRGRCRRGSIGRQAREGFLSGSEVLLTLSPTYRKISQGNRACYLANYLCWPTVHPLLPLTLLYLDRLETALSQQDQFY
jgi:hypothetical protein